MVIKMKALYFLVAILLLCSSVMAIPGTLPATLIGNNNVTMNGNGVVGDVGWFQWSMKTGFVYAHLPNVTSNAGAITFTVKGTPLFGSTTYFYKACDPTGCGAEVQFTTTVVTPVPIPAYGGFATNMTENGFDAPNIVWNSVQAFIPDVDNGETIFFGLLFALVFVSMWLRTRGTATATSFGMICLSLFTISAGGLGLGLPQEFLAAGQALMYLSLTGAILSFTFK